MVITAATEIITEVDINSGGENGNNSNDNNTNRDNGGTPDGVML